MKLTWVLDYDLRALRKIRSVDVNVYPRTVDDGCSIT
jgi:hypothetical protein